MCTTVYIGVPRCDLRRSIVRIGPILGVILVIAGCADGPPLTADCPPSCRTDSDGGLAPDASPGATQPAPVMLQCRMSPG